MPQPLSCRVPTRLHILSDLHLEFGPFRPVPVEADVIVLAGDIGVGRDGLLFARTAWPDHPIVYVAGNHEYYGRSWPQTAEALATEAQRLDIEFLHRRAVVIGGVQYLGATLWTDLNLHLRPRRASRIMRRKMNDYRFIGCDDRQLLPTDTLRANLEAQIWLSETLNEDFEGTRVIVTHHAPTALSLGSRADRPIGAAYASALDQTIIDSGAAVWIHGHVHKPVDLHVGQTRVICNPRGYTDEPTPGFRPDLVVEVP